MTPFVIAVLALASIVVPVLLFELRTTGATTATGWAHAHGVLLSDASRLVVTRHLRTSRWLRRVCAIGAVVTAAALSAAFGFHLMTWWPLWLLVGYLIGAVWAELTLTALPDEGVPVASLSPRTLREYLSPTLRRAQVALPFAAGLVGAVALVRSDSPLVTGGLAFALATGIGVPVAERLLLRRPQPMGAADLVAVDDAMRSSAIHQLCGTGLCVVSLCLALELELIARDTNGEVAIAATSAAAATVLVAEWAFAAWRHQAWVVRRVAVPSVPAGSAP
jgi:hypothetical protein